ncbi:hypothetical protein [Mycolicibacterium sp.]|uniref:hypothetical protein n=1 Tax=Mycolicibacterium sp. TaxID=2320850 RepID=UPI0025F17CA4|nr:hypothetical protein [Mycolicibacterium sp.]
MTSATMYDGVGVAPGRYRADGAPRARYRATLGLLALGLSVAMVVLGVWDKLVEDAAVYNCPPDCGRPPNSVPVAALPRYTAPGEQFSVSYPGPGSPYEVTTGSQGITARYTAGDRGVLQLFGEPAQGRVARRVVTDLLAKQFPKAVVDYELPNAMVGYQLGYGVVANFQRPGLANRFDMRVVIIAAVKNDLALVAVAEGPFRRFSRDFGPGPPSSANVELAIDMGKYVESFSWKGDPPR